MKRKALLICNNDASGATHDIDKWEKFLLSGTGGAWEKTEIEKKVNPTKADLLSLLRTISGSNYDFVIVAYAGHGEWSRSTILEINPAGETINEAELNNLAPREIICLDCCRGVSPIREVADEAELRMFSADQRSLLRQAYDNRMMQAQSQIVKLYACQVGQCAYGDNHGGYYTNHLLDKATDLLPNTDYQTIERAHNMAAHLTTQETRTKVGKLQEPDMASARLTTRQQLIISVSTKMFRIMG
jgi:hypothetical protein